MKEYTFLFNLSGTVLRSDVYSELLTSSGITLPEVNSEQPYQQFFFKVFSLLKRIPVDQASDIILGAQRNAALLSFVAEHRNQCRIVTDLPGAFIDRFCAEINVDYYASRALVCGNKVQRMTQLLDKGALPGKFNGPVVSVGCYDSDAEMIQNSAVGIGYGGVLPISMSVMKNATHAVYSEDRLCRFLRQL